MLTKLPKGTPVRKTMGVALSGMVIRRIPRDQYTDGQYREPLPHERPVYVRWSDGSRGWIQQPFLMPVTGSQKR
jgi:hypothetical protein